MYQIECVDRGTTKEDSNECRVKIRVSHVLETITAFLEHSRVTGPKKRNLRSQVRKGKRVK